MLNQVEPDGSWSGACACPTCREEAACAVTSPDGNEYGQYCWLHSEELVARGYQRKAIPK